MSEFCLFMFNPHKKYICSLHEAKSMWMPVLNTVSFFTYATFQNGGLRLDQILYYSHTYKYFTMYQLLGVTRLSVHYYQTVHVASSMEVPGTICCNPQQTTIHQLFV